MSEAAPRRKRLDERVAPGWANLASTLLRGGGLVIGLFLLWVGYVTGGFFLLLTGTLAAIALIGGWLLGGLVLRESWYERPNARNVTFALVVLFPLALVLLAQVAGPLLTPPPVTAGCISGTLAAGEERHERLAVDPRLGTIGFALRVDTLEGAALRFFIQDPAGQSRFSGRAEQPGTMTSAPIAVQGGPWTVNLVSEADRADYALAWYAATGDAPLPAPPADCL